MARLCSWMRSWLGALSAASFLMSSPVRALDLLAIATHATTSRFRGNWRVLPMVRAWCC